MNIIKSIAVVVIGYSSGVVIASGVFAFIAVLGIVTRFAQKTKTTEYIYLYEDAIIIGGILGTMHLYINYHLPIGDIPAVIISLFIGVFFGSLAVSVAEILNVIPILTRRFKIAGGISALVTSIALGKAAGSLLYYLIPGFYSNI